MTRPNLEIVLPDALAEQAREAGRLELTAVEDMVRKALRARRPDECRRGRWRRQDA